MYDPKIFFFFWRFNFKVLDPRLKCRWLEAVFPFDAQIIGACEHLDDYLNNLYDPPADDIIIPTQLTSANDQGFEAIAAAKV